MVARKVHILEVGWVRFPPPPFIVINLMIRTIISMKVCTMCKQKQSYDNYHKCAAKDDGYFTICKDCRKIATIKYQKKNKEKITAYKKQYRKDFTKWARKFKENKPCTDCNQIFHFSAMQWDHLPKYKKHIDLAQIMPKEKFLEEIKKCELVCANCHSVRTYNRREKLD